MLTLLRNALARATLVPWALRLVWSATEGWMAAWAALLILQGLLPAAAVYLARPLVDALATLIEAGGASSWEQARSVLLLGALMGLAIVLIEALQRIAAWVRAVQTELVQAHLSTLVHSQSVAVDLAFYETPEYFDHLHRARDDAGQRILSLLDSLGALVQNGITLAALGVLLLPYGAWLPLALLASTLPALWVVLRHEWRYHQWWRESTATRRRAEYYDLMLTGSYAAAELRLFGLGGHFQAAYQALRGHLRTIHLRLLRAEALGQLAATTLALLVSGAVLAWMLVRAIRGLASLGDLVLFYQAFRQGQVLMRSLLGSAGQIYSDSLFLGNLAEFLELKPQVTDPPAPVPAPSALQHGIAFRNVTFRYPGSARAALQGFNLEIPAGRVVAIVGENGAGKSTLVKLLCRLYDPETGRIELDGCDLRRFALDELRRNITVLFQMPVTYHVTAGENISMGDLPARPQASAVEGAARAAGAHAIVARLPQGYGTMLGKWFVDGVELSGGEWQRIALARAFLRRAPVVILDEPTSFMDSWAEAEWLRRFRALVGGRTAIVITHRLTTAMHADVIHVVWDGQVVESGTHEDLVVRGGRYAQSWQLQTQRRTAEEGTVAAY
jgi:ATP-binding cassette subfamily B protein